MYEEFSTDVFYENNAWTRTDESVDVVINLDILRINTDDHNNDGFSVQLSDNTQIIETRVRMIEGGGMDKTAILGLLN